MQALSNNFTLLGNISIEITGESERCPSGIALAGDGRDDSMGHNAKVGAYTIFCCILLLIIHFALIQVRVETHGLFFKYK